VTEEVRSTRDGYVQLVIGANGRYAVQVAEQVVFESRVLAAAEIYYTEEVDKHRAAKRDILARERAHFDAQALHSEASARKSAQARRKGGKGGSGGVSG
jgi:predicted ATPase